jgi:hypothetical protein
VVEAFPEVAKEELALEIHKILSKYKITALCNTISTIVIGIKFSEEKELQN